MAHEIRHSLFSIVISAACHMVSSLSGLLHEEQKHFSSSNKRRRSNLANHSYTEEEREKMGNYALIYGSTAAARHFSNVYSKRIPRESVKNFVAMVKKKLYK
uniref:Uncharacterized protein n=1 Tax=Arion vulgaris TaxID=1028688 RepID=A0A0B6ZXC3_9EUPU